MSVVSADLTEIVFESRNKAYGSYVLRKNMGRSTFAAFGIGLSLILIFTVVTPLVQELLKEEEVVDTRPKRQVSYRDLAPPPDIDTEKAPPPPPSEKLPPPPQRASLRFVPPVVKRDEDVKEEIEIQSQDSLQETKAIVSNVQREGSLDAGFAIGDEEGVGDGPVEIQEDRIPDPNEFVAVEQEPRPVNYDELKRKIGYPPLAREAQIQGNVVVRILVGKDGSYVKHVVVSSKHQLLTDAVIKELGSLRFTPGIQAGKPIPVWVTVPFNFKLN